MQYRKLGNSDLEVSVIGFGCWAMGKAFWGDDVVDDDSIVAVRHALDLGITLFDTAAVYGLGHSEKVLAEALGSRRAEIVLATKCGMSWDDAGNISKNSSPEAIISGCEDSLKRLQTDVIDLFQVHWPDETVPFEDTMDALVSLQQAGKIRAIGVSNFSAEQMRRMMSRGELASDQPPYSLLNRSIEREVLPFCRENNVGVLCYSPMSRGLLTGRYGPDATFPATDARSQDGLWQGERFAQALAGVERLKAMAAEYGRTVSQLALAWVVSQPGVTVALAGAKRQWQIAETAAAGDWTLDAAEIARVEACMTGDA